MPNLVGIGLSQVPTNSMLGGMAYQDPEHASIKDLDLKNLSQINSEISDTAVDIFVYDTHKDSDGGAWRKRTQHTSWYNETLGTSTRGTRREFPAVAVIVAEATIVTIYDGDDPDLPMWMIFNVSNTTWFKLHGSGSQCSCVTALNATLCAGGNGAGIRLAVVDFIKDNQYLTEAGYTYYQTSGIITRNDTTTHINDGGTKSILNNVVNDVAVTVLPNAPIDSATGLPVPTIAVATNGGVSVIKDDETIFDVIDSNGARRCYDVSFTKDHKIMHTGDLGAGVPHAGNVFVTNVLTADRTEYDNHGDLYRWYSTSAMYPRINGGNTFNTRVLDPLDVGGHHYAMADVGISLIEDGTSSSYGNTDGMVAYITSDYNTGYQHGDIKGAFLSDTDTTNLTGTELITNGTFDSNTNGWTSFSSATITHTTPSAAGIDSPSTDGLTAPSSAGIIKIVSNGGGSGAYQSFTTVVGKTYTASFIAYQVSYSSNYVYIGTSINGNQNYDFYDKWDQSVNNNWASGTATFTATATTTYISLVPSQVSGRVLYMDQISVRLADPDRSVKNDGPQVHGTIIKTPVATGADLVRYSGFTASNFLKYDAVEMAFGTGDFSVSVWCIPSTDASNEFILELDDSSQGSNRFYLLTTATATKKLYTPWSNNIAGSELIPGEWNHVVVGRKSGYGFVYVNNRWIPAGYLAYTTTLNGNGFGMIGNYTAGPSNDYAWSGSLALLRISGSAPSAEQVSKMYHDEKCLFHENAKATLYGSSDAVTGLAFDDTTNLLHVGTSAGRSEFQGLRRINNTTTAVTTAISVSNGLVAEQ